MTRPSREQPILSGPNPISLRCVSANVWTLPGSSSLVGLNALVPGGAAEIGKPVAEMRKSEGASVIIAHLDTASVRTVWAHRPHAETGRK